ncbi:pyruvate/2-oxoglutarate dehydrogenase complex dihydrolipoamide dehydrogenase (E3) component [Arcanobacterium wilhelmae]|uniref:Pyruvate/2-oxoglutarate dehydrogenase complex dihydrolipoamide dehydrogenase (E3) component n=1 Tax=Arcanobacterium wilhelmae TaxID=1803177 RepID=A0ABT9N9J1_9ACTO|nr:FAD-dependent oxidoreductase [Arcanobacterium wilhelmae]MDP9800369.1 pyruvate/2-oxoglutarate dehydrogenase complex dihydrolipoamide dehydrogenase (E3) component [Arcanobacterium wilhelmae]WFN89800.1 FAD-dependent oxidoreductase [Arcanobacterium wilhelmae]
MEFDVLVIGWGKAGKSVAGKLVAAGKKVALVEQSATMYGGTCINVACVPTKTLITAAEARREGDDPAAYFETSVAKRDALISKLNSANHGMLEGKVALFDGRAEFVGPHEVRITPTNGGTDEVTLKAETIIINTGAVPAVPNIPGTDLEGVYDSTTIQHAQPFPARLAIVGGGTIGLEFATMFNEFGSQVTVVTPGERLFPRLDDDVAQLALETMQAQGIEFSFGHRASAIEKADDGLDVVFDGGRVNADAVLLAVGRTPATAGLGLEAAGIATDERGFVKVDDHLRTNVDGVYAVGDVNGGPQFTYISFDDHRILADELLGDGTRSTADRVAVPTATFINPPLATVGMSEKEAKETGRTVRVDSKKIAEIPVMPRPKIVGNPAGMAKFMIDADTDEILGAVLYSIDSQELINTVALAMRLGAPAATLRDGIWTHPASTEVFNGVIQ